MNKTVYILIIILILIIIILNIYKSNKKISDDITIFSLWNNIVDQEYQINPQNSYETKIDIFQTISNKNGGNKKIAPGSFGKFKIKITKPLDSKCEIQLKNITAKPHNLIYSIGKQQYYSIEKLQEELNNIFQNQDIVTLNWNWTYENDYDGNIKDTEDGENAQKYIFEIKAIVEEEKDDN